MLVAYRSHPDETKAMRDAFKAYDVDLNGRVSREEFQNVLKKQGYTDQEVIVLVPSPHPPPPPPPPSPSAIARAELPVLARILDAPSNKSATDGPPHAQARHAR